MREPAVTLTDYGLTLECAVFALLLFRVHRDGRGLRSWLVLFFASASAAPLLGGTVHGFFADEQTLGRALLWRASLLAIGVTALSGWQIGARLCFEPPIARWIGSAAALQLALYSAVVILWVQGFWIAVVDYLPAALFLLGSLLVAHRREALPGARLGAAGLALSLVAAVIQRLGLSPHPIHFNHNALYHVVQALAFLLIFLGARRILAR